MTADRPGTRGYAPLRPTRPQQAIPTRERAGRRHRPEQWRHRLGCASCGWLMRERSTNGAIALVLATGLAVWGAGLTLMAFGAWALIDRAFHAWRGC